MTLLNIGGKEQWMGSFIVVPWFKIYDQTIKQSCENLQPQRRVQYLREAATRLADGGSIINFSTSVNRLMLPTYGTYVATKSTIEQLTRVFSREIDSIGINVNSVSPGPTNTALFVNGKSQETIDRLASLNPFGRIGEPNGIAEVVVFLASDDSKWINTKNSAFLLTDYKSKPLLRLIRKYVGIMFAISIDK